MNHFCTLFDSFYLSRGVALYESLRTHCDNFHLYVFTFDDVSFKILSSQNFEYMTIINLPSLERWDARLPLVKDDRSKGEYCWTCTGSIIRYCIEKYNLGRCTYLDADLYFFSNPQALLNELDGKDKVLITSHRYTEQYDQSSLSGKYCVQFMSFSNTELSMKVLVDWIDDCIDWCYAKFEDGKFGDQKYLDRWPCAYPNIHELSHLGGGVAPWNVQQYTFKMNNSVVQGIEMDSRNNFDLVFFHFHALKFISKGRVNLSEYDLNTDVVDNIYAPYVTHLNLLNERYGDLLVSCSANKNANLFFILFNNLKKALTNWKKIPVYLFKRMSKNKNIFKVKELHKPRV